MKDSGVNAWVAIGRSWLSLKPWVKMWLFFLNAIFLAALVLPDSPLRSWILYTYVAAGMCLLPIMLAQRGLTRLLGIGHLIPWVPLVVYLTLRLTSGLAGPQLTWSSNPHRFAYVALLLSAVLVCLALDAYDLYRWLRGERYIMGSAVAVAAGASLPAPGGSAAA